MKTNEYRSGNTILEVYDDSICEAEDVKKIVERIEKINDAKPLEAKRASA